MIYLSPSEAAKAKQTAQDLTSAQDRADRARTAWQSFHQSYQAAHPELPGLKFASDFQIAFALKNPPSPLGDQVAAVELSAQEREKAESLQRQMVEAKRALDEASKNWLDYQHELVFDHFPSARSGQIFTLSNGKPVTIPGPWNFGAAFTPDFRVAVPRLP